MNHNKFMRWTLPFAVIAGGALAWALLSKRPDSTTGWVTEHSAQHPFPPGIIVNGQPPPDYEVTVEIPGPYGAGEVKSGAPFRISAKVRIIDLASPNSSVPPTFVFARILKGKKVVGLCNLQGVDAKKHVFTYKGEIPAPAAPGTYGTTILVDYTVTDPADATPIHFSLTDPSRANNDILSPNVRRREFQGPNLHVRR